MAATPVLRETRSFRPFKSSEEYLYAMKEDLAEWLSMLYPELDINVDNFMDKLDTGVALCKHANNVRRAAEEYVQRRQARKLSMSSSTVGSMAVPVVNLGDVRYLQSAQPGTFFARDNVSNFITWCRHGICVMECLLFETDDLILRKNEKNVILCLLDVARRGARFGMLAPMLVQLEREIDREIAAEQRALQRGNSVVQPSDEEDDELDGDGYSTMYGPVPQIVTNDLKSLDEMVRDLVERCSCPVQFPMIRVSEGKYRIGDTKVLIFVRVLRNHVMVRVGGGWDTLSHYLDKHDPCRCKTAHRSPLSTKLILHKQGSSLDLNHSSVHYERSPPRTRRSSASSISSGGGREATPSGLTATAAAPRSRSPTPRRSLTTPRPVGRSRSPTPQRGGLATPRSATTRSRSPTPQRSLMAPTQSSRSRSRSPTPQRNLATPRQAGRSRSPTPQRTLAAPRTTKSRSRSPVIMTSTAHITLDTSKMNGDNHNDSGSEVSDEGYRSLGTVVVSSPPAASDGKCDIDKEKGLNDSVVDATTTERPEDLNETQQTSSSDSVLSGNEDTSLKSRAPSSDRETTPVRSTAEVKLRQRSVDRKPPKSRSSIGDDSGFAEAPAELFNPSPIRKSSKAKPPTPTSSPSLGRNTWSGKGKTTRPALTENTFSAPNSPSHGLGARNSVQRRSLGAYGSSHSTPTKTANSSKPRVHKGSLPASLQSSPTKQISPLVEEILQVQNLADDLTVLNKMKEIIEQYATIVDQRLVEENKRLQDGGDVEPPSEEIDFTTAWVHGNGSLNGIQTVRRKSSCSSVPGDLSSNDSFRMSSKPNPRKDSKTDLSVSRIPAPTFYRPPSTTQLTALDS